MKPTCTSRGHVQSAPHLKSPEQRTHYKMASQCRLFPFPVTHKRCGKSAVFRGASMKLPLSRVLLWFLFLSARIAAFGPSHVWWSFSVPFSPVCVNESTPPLHAAALSFLCEVVPDTPLPAQFSS